MHWGTGWKANSSPDHRNRNCDEGHRPGRTWSCIVDSTVQEKAIAFPTIDSRLLDVARRKLVLIAKRAGVVLRQTFEKEGRSLKRQAGSYARQTVPAPAPVLKTPADDPGPGHA